MLYHEIHDFINKQINQIGNLKEENVKIHLVIPILNLLGYDKNFFDFEYTRDHKNKIVDMAWICNNDMIYIEVKRGDYDIAEADVKQLTDYIVSKNISWGILTNGKRYILINKNIDCIGFGEKISIDRIAIDENLIKNNKKSKINYLSKEYIFDNKCTDYFRDIAQFRVYYLTKKNNKSSWRQYNSTLNNFTEYLTKKYGKYKSLSNIGFEDYIDYWKDKIVEKNKVKSIETFKAQHSHVASLFSALHENGKITNNNFAYITNKEIENAYNLLYNKENSGESDFVLNEQNVIKAYNILNIKKDNNRNIIILFLAIYCGITRSEIISMQWEDIDLKKDRIKLKDRIIPLPKAIKEKLNALNLEYKRKKIKTSNVFCTYYDKKYNAITISSVSFIFDTLKECFWIKCSLEKICSNLIPLLYQNGYSIEEISFLTGKSLSILEKNIPYNIMIKGIRLDKSHKERKHPFTALLQL